MPSENGRAGLFPDVALVDLGVAGVVGLTSTLLVAAAVSYLSGRSFAISTLAVGLVLLPGVALLRACQRAWGHSARGTVLGLEITAVAALWWLGAEATAFADVIATGHRRASSLANPLETIAGIVGVLGLLALPEGPPLTERVGVLIDGALVSAGALFATWTVIGGSIEKHTTGWNHVLLLVRPVSAVALGPVALFVLLWCMRQNSRRFPTIVVGGLGTMALCVSNLAAPTQAPLVGGFSWWTALAVAGYCLLGIASLAVIGQASGDRTWASGRVMTRLPLAFVIVCALIGCVDFGVSGRAPTLGIYIIGGALCVLVLTRQLVLDHQLGLLQNHMQARVDHKVSELASQERFFTALVHHSSDAILAVDRLGRFVAVSDAAAALLGRSTASLTGERAARFLAPGQLRRVWGRVVRLTSEGNGATCTLGFRVRAGDGVIHDMYATVSNQIEDPDVRAIIINARDVTDRVQLQRRLARQAWFDDLTGLANRSLLHQALERSIAGPSGTGLVFIDIDDFKLVNDTMGHAAGDELLRAVASRLLAGAADGETVARLGGDEFAVVVTGTEADAMARAEQILESLRLPVTVGDQRRHLGVSAGVAMGGAGQRPADLLRSADLAMYAAKAEGKGRVARYDPAMLTGLTRRAELAEDLAVAVEQRDLSLVYQPVFALSGTGALHGFEALLRWDHPTHGNINPEAIVDLADRSDLMLTLGDWTLRQACADLVTMGRALARTDLVMGVNLVGRQLDDRALASSITTVLDTYSLQPSRLVLELSEHSLLPSGPGLRRVHELHDAGVLVALDNFGAGYSSFGRLQQIPVDMLKLDRSLVDRVPTPRETAIVKMLVDLAHVLGALAVAEGLESREQTSSLRAMGCDLGQGYHLCTPMERDALVAHLLAGDPVRV